MNSAEPYVTILFPCYNEALTIGKDIDDAHVAMKTTEHTYEIMIVDDGSTDQTAAIAKAHGARVIQHPRNRGVGWARKTGLRWARGTVIVMSDGDGTYPLKETPVLLRELEHSDMVIGARRVEAGTVPWLRTPAKLFLKTLASLAAGQRIVDLNSGMRAFYKDTAMRFMNILPDTHSWVSTITIAYLCNGYNVSYVPIDYYPRLGKSTFHPIKDTLTFLNLIMKTMLFFRPLRFFIPLASALSLWGLAKFIFDWQVYSDVRESDIMIILVGIIVGTLGLLADMIISAQRANYLDPKPTHDKEL